LTTVVGSARGDGVPVGLAAIAGEVRRRLVGDRPIDRRPRASLAP
jgi:hypothetical protein